MLGAALAIYLLTTIAFAVLCAPFLRAVEAEAPDVYAAWGKPSASEYLWKNRVFMPFSGLLLFRQYQEALREHPKARAWASWLSVLHWIQVAALVAFVFGIVGTSMTSNNRSVGDASAPALHASSSAPQAGR